MIQQVLQKPKINTSKLIQPRIYAYITPRNEDTKNLIKIGYTERSVDARIREQTRGMYHEKLWDYPAKYNAGNESYFKDHDFHGYLTKHEITRKYIYGGTEWFDFGDDMDKAEKMFIAFTYRKSIDDLDDGETAAEYILRNEQQEAVNQTLAYFDRYESGEFLWNAKPRFGKTLTSYDLIKRMGAKSILVLTNRPAVGNSWVDDYEKFLKNDESTYDYKFVSDSPAISHRKILTREEYMNNLVIPHQHEYHINFVSLQDLKGAQIFGGAHKKLDWITDIHWDLVIIDESHEAVDTRKTQFALDKIKKDYLLHLSGTPFKQLAGDDFSSDQIFNWTYMDEQEAKENWDEEETGEHNPYAELPALSMYTYQMSNMILDKVQQGADIDGETNVDYAFDLNEFFSTTDSGRFVYEEDVLKWLDSLTSNERYPFSTEILRNELKHTLWLLNRVDSAKELARLLKKHDVFKEYEIISVAGDGKLDRYNGEEIETDVEDITGRNTALERVQKAIKDNDKTITLTVGQLTTGVTVPEWSAVLMLSNVQSPALYMQAAFRAQNPYSWNGQVRDSDGKLKTMRFRKHNAYVFDFSPERTLDIIDEFANNLISETADGGGTEDERKQNIKRLLNFFPVIGEDEDGVMVELSPDQVLTLPKRFKSREVVRRGFMSNLLFNNISRIFASKHVLDIVNKFEKTEEGKLSGNKDKVDEDEFDEVKVDSEGNVDIDEELVEEKRGRFFGDKVYAEIVLSDDGEPVGKKITETIMQDLEPNFEKVRDEYDMTKAEENRKVRDTKKKVEQAAEHVEKELVSRRREIDYELEKLEEKVETKEDKIALEELRSDYDQQFVEEANAHIATALDDIKREMSEEVVRDQEVKKEEKKKKTVEDDIRSNLRGFARAIPSFIMAYGDDDLRLVSFDKYVDKDVFKDVTGVSLEEFIFLRDGGYYIDDNGEEQKFDGGLFNEVVFDESIREFLRLRSELANYFEDTEENIYDYIPPQNTNQIYTPKWVVQKMVQQLEDENPGIYNDSSKTFIDLYMKSGLYITEVVKRLYNSEIIKSEIPNDHERLKHILENQVYGLAPTEIIYRIATSFIFSELTEGISQKNFAQLDAYPYAEAGTLEEKLDKVFD